MQSTSQLKGFDSTPTFHCFYFPCMSVFRKQFNIAEDEGKKEREIQ